MRMRTRLIALGSIMLFLASTSAALAATGARETPGPCGHQALRGGEPRLEDFVDASGELSLEALHSRAGNASFRISPGSAFMDPRTGRIHVAIPQRAGSDRGPGEGSWWNGFGDPGPVPGVDGAVHAITIYNGDVIVAGWFANAGTVSAPCIARWDGSSWSPLGSRSRRRGCRRAWRQRPSTRACSSRREHSPWPVTRRRTISPPGTGPGECRWVRGWTTRSRL